MLLCSFFRVVYVFWVLAKDYSIPRVKEIEALRQDLGSFQKRGKECRVYWYTLGTARTQLQSMLGVLLRPVNHIVIVIQLLLGGAVPKVYRVLQVKMRNLGFRLADDYSWRARICKPGQV